MELTGVAGWRKSTFSGGNGGACVEVGNTARAAVAVRDTTDREGTALTIPLAAWNTFVATVK
ncbi:MAG: DUF397 domain-containing protein [Streptosporangiales bacterium]|nr:DUF397 domain-containing protein [Streptosporangiales bacterium]